MDCARVEELLSALLDEELDDRAPVEAHLRDCARCAETWRLMKQDDAALDRLMAPARDRADGLEDRVLAMVRRERRSFRILPTFAAAAAGFLAAVVLFRPWEKPAAPPPPPRPIATVTTGTVEVYHDGQWKEASMGADVLPGMAVRTGEKSRGEIVCNDGSVIRMDENTQMSLKSQKEVTLEKGNLWASGEVQVDAGDSKIVAPEGCMIDVKKKKDTTDWTCESGGARVTDKTGKDLELKEKQTVKVKEGKAEEPRPVHDLDMANKWVLELLAEKGGDDPELARRLQFLLARIGEAKVDYFIEDEVKALGTSCVKPLKAYVEESAGAEAARGKRRTAAEWLSQIATTDHIPDLVALLGDADPEVRTWMAERLAQLMGRKSFPRGSKFFRYESPDASEADLARVPATIVSDRWTSKK
jgi:ferric-dicitrate binding protein FerR (iron transport regulator)